GDAAAAAVGITGPDPGRDHASLGTSGWVASIRPAAQNSSIDGASHRLALAGGGELRISALLPAGAAAAWARSAYLAGADVGSAARLLQQREPARGRGPTGLLVLPSLGRERFPVRDENLRGPGRGLDAAPASAAL